jgi:predicted RNase H-like HicB family nuclease
MVRERYAMDSHFTGVFQRVAGGWVGSVEELPGANTQGSTLEETRENLKEAIRLVLEANRELAQRETQGRDVVRESIVVSL